ncbi:HTH domain-containing protein [Catellatospora methionotrophica]|uniref:HTH domain-containing protein n=1 Tax=Catellatospora methionotrophica TaxID=121620 RepID=UPI0033D11CB5
MIARTLPDAIADMAARIARSNFRAGVACAIGQYAGKTHDHFERAAVRQHRALRRLTAALATAKPARKRTSPAQKPAAPLVTASADVAVSARTSATIPAPYASMAAPPATTTAKVAEWTAQRPDITTAQLADMLGVTARTIRRAKAALRAGAA